MKATFDIIYYLERNTKKDISNWIHIGLSSSVKEIKLLDELIDKWLHLLKQHQMHKFYINNDIR